jgi:hypothetical protein
MITTLTSFTPPGCVQVLPAASLTKAGSAINRIEIPTSKGMLFQKFMFIVISNLDVTAYHMRINLNVHASIKSCNSNAVTGGRG